MPHFEDEVPLRPLVFCLTRVVLDVRNIPALSFITVLVEPRQDFAKLWHKILVEAVVSEISRRRHMSWCSFWHRLLFATAEEERSRDFARRNDEFAELAESGLAKFHAFVCCEQSSLVGDLQTCSSIITAESSAQESLQT